MNAATDLERYLSHRRAEIDGALDAALPRPPACPPAVADAMRYSLMAGGKRLRPLLTVVAAQVAIGPTDTLDPELLHRALRGGISCELVQTGSLYHDDVMDEAETRRGVDTVNAKWGNLQAILAGDFLLARASEIAASLSTEVAGLLAATIGRLCEGQIEELRHTYNAARPEASYLSSISGKTSSLFSAAARIGGLVEAREAFEIAAPEALIVAPEGGQAGWRQRQLHADGADDSADDDAQQDRQQERHGDRDREVLHDQGEAVAAEPEEEAVTKALHAGVADQQVERCCEDGEG